MLPLYRSVSLGLRVTLELPPPQGAPLRRMLSPRTAGRSPERAESHLNVISKAVRDVIDVELGSLV